MSGPVILKANTHVHANGMATDEDVLRLARKNGKNLNDPEFSHIDSATGRRLWADGHHSASHEAYDQTVRLICNPSDLRDVAYGGLIRDAEQGCIYTRLLASGMNNCRSDTEAIDVFERNTLGTIAAIKDARAETGLEVFLSITAKRHLTDGPARAHRLLDAVEAFQKKYPDEAQFITGFDMAGNEEHANCTEFHTVFDRACRLLKLPCSCHAGEVMGSDDVRTAMMLPGVKIIAHALSAINDPKLIQELVERRILVEQLPISNDMLHGVRYPSGHHPLPEYVATALTLALGTDDPGLQKSMFMRNRSSLGTNIGDEYDFVERRYGFKAHQLLVFTANAVRYGFMPAETKTRLLNRVQAFARDKGIMMRPQSFMLPNSNGQLLRLDA